MDAETLNGCDLIQQADQRGLEEEEDVFRSPVGRSVTKSAVGHRAAPAQAKAGHPPPGNRDLSDLKNVESLSNKQRAQLWRAGFSTTQEILYTPLPALAERLKASPQETRAFIDAIVRDRVQKVNTRRPGSIFDSRSVAELCDLQNKHGETVSTGDRKLDELLGGGIKTGMLTEITGEASSGKTALALQLSLQVQLGVTDGGLGGSCAYLSSEGNFPSSRLLAMAGHLVYHTTDGDMKARNSHLLRSFTDNVHLIHCAEVESLLHGVRYSLPALIDRTHRHVLEAGPTLPRAVPETDLTTIPSTYPIEDSEETLLPRVAVEIFPQYFKDNTQRLEVKPVRLVVLDSIAAPFRGAESAVGGHAGEKPSGNHLTERTRDLAEIAAALHRLAQKYNIAVVIINQVSDVFAPAGYLRSDGNLPSSSNSSQSDRSSTTRNDGIPLEYTAYADASKWFSGESAGTGGKMAVFGLAWTNLINSRIMLSKTGRRRRIRDGREMLGPVTVTVDADGGDVESASEAGTEQVRRMDVIFSPWCEPGYAEYVIRQPGLVGVKDKTAKPRGRAVGTSRKRKTSAASNGRYGPDNGTTRPGSSDAEARQAEETGTPYGRRLPSSNVGREDGDDDEGDLWQGLDSDPPLEDLQASGFT